MIQVGSHQSAADLARALDDYSLSTGLPIGLDTETTSCDPKKEGPVGKAELWCLTLAWRTGQDIRRAFVPREYVYRLGLWLGDAKAPKVGTNIFGYDRHVIWNLGMECRGIVGDTLRMSRLLDPSKTAGHDLKTWGERLGWETIPYSAIAGRPAHGKPKTYKRDRVVNVEGVPTIYTAGSDVYPIKWGTTEYVPLQELWEQYPERRELILDYATQDAAMSLDVYEHLREEMERRKW